MVKIFLAALLYLGLSLAAQAQTGCIPNPNVTPLTNSPPGFVDGCSLSAAGLNSLLNQFNPQGWYSATANGLKCDGATDDTVALNNLIATLSNGGGHIMLSTNCVFAGTITLNTQGVSLWCPGPNGGPGGLRPINMFFTGTGTQNAINIGTQGTSTQTYFLGVHDCNISNLTRTGGYIFSVFGASQVFIDTVFISSSWQALYGQFFNNVHLRDVSGYTRATSGAMFNLFAPAGAGNAGRSDVFTMDSVNFNGQTLGADGIQWDGPVYTLRLYKVAMLGCGTGLHVMNSAASATFYPQYLLASDLEVDGCGVGGVDGTVKKNGVEIDAGSDFHITNSDIDVSNAPNSCTVCYPFATSPDTGNSVTREIYLTNVSLHNAPFGAAYINARTVNLDGVSLGFLCLSGASCGPAVDVAASAFDARVSNSFLNSSFAGNSAVTYGGQVEVGAAQVSFVGNHYTGAATNNVNNLSASPISFIGGIGRTGAVITVTSCAAATAC